MKLEYVIFNMIAAGGLFFLNGILGKVQYGLSGKLFEYGKFTFEGDADQSGFSGNFFQKIVNPAVYLAVVAAIAQHLLTVDFIESMWLLIPIFWIYRLLFMIIKNVFVFLNLKYEAIALALSLLLGETIFFRIIKPLLVQNESIWIPATELRDALWFAILTYLAKVVWEIMKQSFSNDNLYPDSKRRELVWARYDRFNRKYGNFIVDQISRRYIDRLNRDKQNRLASLLYAIMIYEDYNRPFLIRQAEYILKATFFRQRAMTLGIMQFKAFHKITDIESISYAIDFISLPFLRNALNPENAAIAMYNSASDYCTEVQAIYDILMSRFSDVEAGAVDNESYRI